MLESTTTVPPLTEKAQAIFDFAGWLTTRREAITLSAAHDASPIADLIKEYLELAKIPMLTSPPCTEKSFKSQPPADVDVFKCPQRYNPINDVHMLPDDDWWRGDNTCSYCGSMHPNTFMDLVRNGTEVIPTDKNYKAYVRTAAQGQAKFYFDHLSEAQKLEFVDLVNEKKILYAEPGRFYVLPYFMQVVATK